MRSETFIRNVAVLAAVATAGCNAVWGNDWGELAPAGASGSAAGGQGGLAGAYSGGAGGSTEAGPDVSAGGAAGSAGADASAGASGLGGAGGVGGAGVPDSGADTGNTGGTGGTGGSGGSGGTGGLGGVDGGDASTPDGKGGVDAGTDGAGGVSDAAPDVAPVNPDGGTFVPSNAQSCVQADGGTLLCNRESCCTSIIILPGGEPFMQGRSVSGTDRCPGGMTCYSDEQPEHSSTVSAYALDKYEVTVGRFRNFVAAYDALGAPVAGAGVNPNISGTGWPTWNTSLPASQAEFKTFLNGGSFQTWTDAPGTAAQENRAINYVSWYEAFAFCIWDGGRLATESEWEYAAAGGGGADGNRLYPWGSTAPTCTYANFDPGAIPYCGPEATLAVAPVGSYAAGNGKWGHADLAGNVWEWTFDWYAAYSISANNNYANITPSPYRVLRGGYFNDIATYQRVAYRNSSSPGSHYELFGIRCARNPQ